MTPELWQPYERVSSDEQARRGTSIPEQRGRIHDLALRSGGTLLPDVADEGVSGRTMFRPGIAKLTELAMARAFNVLVADEITRLHRCDAQFELWVQDVLIPNGIRIELVSGAYDTTGDPDAWLAGKFGSIMGDHSSRKLSKRLRDAATAKSKSGKLVSGRPFGSKRNPLAFDPNRPAGYIQRVKDEDTYPALLEIFQRRARGEGFSGIARELQRRGVPTVEGGAWFATTVRSIVQCRWYLGQISHKGQVVATADHDCMVPRELWHAAQLKPHVKPAKLDRVFLLRGLVVSSHFRFTAPESKAGQPLIYSPRKNKGHYYYARIDNGNRGYYSAEQTGEDAVASMLPADQLEEMVVMRVAQITETDELLTSALDRAEPQESQAEAVARLKAQLRTARLDHGKAERSLLAAIEDGATEAVSPLNTRVRAARELIEQLEDEVQRVQREPDLLQQEAMLDKVNKIGGLWEGGKREELALLLHELIEQVDVRVDGVWITPRPVAGAVRMTDARKVLAVAFAYRLGRWPRRRG